MDKPSTRRLMRKLGIPDPEVTLAVVEALYRWMSSQLPGTVAAYLAMSDEVDVAPLFERLPGWRWVLPRVEDDGALTLRDRDLPRETHRWGMEQPVAAGRVVPVHELDMILVPGIAFDRSGARLGRGGGYYDRLLEECRRDCRTVGVTWEHRLLDTIPVEEHDRSVGFLATESGVVPCRPRN